MTIEKQKIMKHLYTARGTEPKEIVSNVKGKFEKARYHRETGKWEGT